MNKLALDARDALEPLLERLQDKNKIGRVVVALCAINAIIADLEAVQVEPVAQDVLFQTQVLRDAADRLIDSGYSATGAEIRMAAKAIESALAKATS
jgi:hypothetical protein